MSSFDIDNYLRTRADADSKLQQLADASQQKVAELSAIKAQTPVKQSWSDQLGLSDGGFLSNRVNDVASIVSGTGRLAGQIASLPTSVAGMAATDGLLPGDYEAYNRNQTGQSTPADLQRLARESAPGLGAVLDRFKSAEALRGTSRKINDVFDVTSIVDQGNRDSLAGDLKAGFEPAWNQVTKGWDEGKSGQVVSGLASLFANAGSAILSNPSAVREYALENAPQLFVGLLGKAGQGAMAASNVGYAADTFQQGMENYAKANGGQLPPEALRNDMAIKAASLALAEHAGDTIGLAATKLAGTAAKEAITGTATAATRTGFKNSLFNVGKATAEGIASEAPTEGYQTWAEGEITGKPASALDIYTGAVIGGASGGALSGGGRMAKELLTPAIPLTPEQLLEKASQAKAALAEQASFKAAADTNDPTVFADPASPSYNPAKAVGVLLKHVQSGKAPQDVQEANLEQAHSIVNGLEDRFNDGAYAVAKAKGTAADLDAIRQELATDKAEFAALSPAGIQAGGAAYEASIAMNESILALAADPAALKAKQAELVTLNKQFTAAQGPRDMLAKLVQLKPENLAAQVDLADEAIDPADTAGQAQAQQAIKRVLNFSMAAPDKVSDETIQRLVENTGNGLTETQRTYLRQFSAARIAQNLLKDGDIVQNEILNGDKAKGQMGIKDYNSEIGAAIAAKSGKTARNLIEQLNKFAGDHAGKQAAVEAAIKQATEAGPGAFYRVVSDGQRGWSVHAGKFAEGERVKNGGLDINSNSGELLGKIVQASAALDATVAKQEAAYAMAFDKPLAANKAATPTPSTKIATKTAAVPKVEVSSTPTPPSSISNKDTKDDEARVNTEVLPPSVGDQTTSKPAVQPTEPTKAEGKAAPAEVVAEAKQEAKAPVEQEISQTGDLESDTNGRWGNEEGVAVEASKAEEEVAAVPQEAAATIPGDLTALQDKSAPEVPYQLRNVLADYFTQSVKSDTALSLRPLVQVKNFVSALLVDKTRQLQDFFTDKLNDAQLEALDGFLNQAQAWQQAIQANLPTRKEKPEYRLSDIMQFLLTPEGVVDVDENVKTAIALAAYTWASDAATSPMYLKPKEFNSILGRKDKVRVSEWAYKVLGKAGTYQHNIVDSLGGKVLESLGLKALPDAPKDLVSTLRATLGMHALKLLEDQGLVKRTKVMDKIIQDLREEGLSEKQINKLRTESPRGDPRVEHYFFAVARDEQGKPVAKVMAINEANKGTQGILGKLFQVETGASIPSLAPITTTQSTTSGTQMGVPGELKAAALAHQARAWVVRQDTLALFDGFDEDVLHAMMGVVPEDDSTTHISNRISVKAKNDGLKREYAEFIKYVGEHLATSDKKLDTEFFLEFNVWKQQRFGISTTAVNPQTSKIVRFLIGSPKWTATIEPANDKQMTSFYLRVAEGLGMKTERADNSVSELEVQNLLKHKVYAAAIEALGKQLVRKEELSAEEKQSIVDAVIKGGANLHSLDALIGVAYQQEAKGEPFTVKMMGEVDGVANGTMLSHVLWGAASSTEALQKVLHMGGFYEVGNKDKHTQYNRWRGTQGNRDIYETTAFKIHAQVRSLVGTGGTQLADQLGSIWAIAGNIFDEAKGVISKDGRNLAKDAMNPLAFGSSLETVVAGMADKFVGNVVKGFESRAKQKEAATQAEIDAYVGHVNSLLGDKSTHLPLGAPLSQHLDTRLATAVEKQLKAVYAETVGDVVTSVLEIEFADFLARRESLTRTTGVTFEISDAINRGMREAYIEELVAAGELPLDAKGNRLSDLSEKQEAELTKRLRVVAPILQTASSQNDKGTQTGMRMAKSQRKQNKDGTYKTVAEFGTPLANGAKSTTLYGQSVQEVTPGVAMVSAATHSTDSVILNPIDQDVLPIHDAAGAGVDGLEVVARALNQRTWETLLNYSPLEQAHQALANVVQGLAGMLDNDELSPQAVKYVQEVLRKQARRLEVKPETVLRTLLTESKADAFDADSIKLGFMKVLASIDQYAFQGGNYEVTEGNRKEAAAKEAALSRSLAQLDQAALEFLDGFMQHKPVAKKATVAAKEESVIVEADSAVEDGSDLDVVDEVGEPVAPAKPAPASTAASPWGEVGTPIFQDSDLAILAALEAAPGKEMTGSQAIALVKELLGKRELTGTEQVWQLMLGKIEASLPAGLVVRLIAPNTPADKAVKAKADNSRGWYAAEQGEVIHLLGPEFKHSYLTPEILLHELYHAAVSAVVHDTRDIAKAVKEQGADKGKLTEAKKLVDELEALLSTVRKFVGTDAFSAAKKAEFAAAISDVDEFISWGMTNRAFQEEVLNNPKLKYTASRSAMKRFLDLMSQIVFGKNASPKVSDAVSVLMGNVSGLFAYATQDKTKRDINLSMASPQHPVHSHTTQSMYEALADASHPVSAEFNEHLNGLLEGIVNKLHGPFGAFKEALMKDQPLNADEVFQKAQATGIAPFASLLLGAGFGFSAQEAYVAEQVEATVRAALEGNESETHAIYSTLSRLFDEQAERLTAKDFFTGPDWSAATVDEVKQAQKLRDFMFKVNPSNGGRNDYLSRFAALGLSHEGFNTLMQAPTKAGEKILADNHPAGILTRLFQRILAWFNGKATNTHEGQAGNAKLMALVDQLAGIEAKKKFRLANPGRNLMAPVDAKFRAGAEFAKEKLVQFGNADFFRKSKSGYLKGAGAVIRMVGAEERVGKMMEGLTEIYDKEVKGKHGFTLSLIQELTGQKPVWEKLLSYAKNNERVRKHVITQTAQGVLGSFVNNGKGIDRDGRKAVTNAFIRTGAHVLLDNYDTKQMELLLKSPKALAAEIAAVEAQLTGFSPKVLDYYLNQGKVLAYQLVSGKVVDEHLMRNAGNIARLLGTVYQGRLTQAQTQAAEKTLDVLISLYAMDYLGSLDKQGAIKVLKAENARADGGNGVHMVMLQHKALEQKARETVFAGQEILMQKGYTAEIYNPYIDMQVVNEEEGKELVQKGYVFVADLDQDVSDQDKQGRSMYVLMDGGKMPYQSGFTSLTSMRSRGTSMHSGSTDFSTKEGLYAIKMQKRLLQEKQAGIAAMFEHRPGFDPRAVKETFLAPVLNAQGDSVNYAYLMANSTKDLVLERNNDFAQVLGAQAGSVYDKVSSAKQNRAAVQALKDHADADYAENSHAYERIGPKSTDAELLEIYRMFPESMKQDIREVWGQDGMLVRKDTMRIAFGYRKFSASDTFDKEWAQRNWAEKIFADTTEYLMYSYARSKGMSHDAAEQYKKQAAVQVRKGERMWQGMVQSAKDNIVIKTGTVMFNNITDNLSLLWISGVPVKSMLKYHGVATQGILDYERDSQALFQLQMQVVPGSTARDIPGLQDKIAKLENAIARNPVKPLVDAGLMPSIIEDVSQDDDGYGYKSQFNRWVAGRTEKLNPALLKAGRQLYMTHDTTAYKSLAQITKMSDFVARYTLYQHLIERKANPLSHEEAIQQAKDSFIDYDVPLHSGLQYTEDMGITMFTKYFLRIQRVLYKQVRENPSRVLTNVLVSNYLDWVPDVMDASAWHHLGNDPIRSGAIQFMGSVGSIGTLASAKAGLSLFP